MRRHTRFGLVFALSLSLTAPLLAKELLSKELLSKETLVAQRQEGAKPSAGSTAGRKRDSDRDAEPKVCRLPVRFTQSPNDGLRAQPEKYDNPEFRQAYYLLSINGIMLAGKSAQEIKKFNRGTLGESAVLGILNRDLEYKEFSLPYEMLRRDQRMQVKKSNVRSMLYRYDGTNGPSEGGSRGDEFEMFDLPVFASAWAEQNVLDAQDSPATSSAVVDNAAAESAQILLQVGNIDPAKPVIKLLQQSPLVDTKNRRRETDKFAKLIPLLDLWGMNREAVSIGTKLITEIKPAETNNAKTPTAKSQPAISTIETERFYDANNNRLQTYIALSKVIKNSGEAAAFESTAPALEEQTFNRNSNSFWLADYFEKVGKFDQAIALYEKALLQFEKPGFVNAAINKDVSTARLRAYLLVRLAQIENKRGHSADDYLKRAAEVYRSNFNKEQLALIERIPGFSPSLNQIEAAISDNKKLDNPKDKKDENRLLASLGPVATRTDASDKEIEFAAATLSAYAALEKSDYDAVQRYTNKLIEIYKQEEIRTDYPRPSINIYCSLISFAEKLSNKGRFEQANKLLDQLKTADKDFDSNDASAFFIDLEQTLNTSRSKKSEESWKALFSSWNSGYQEYEGLRALAALYTTAGDTTRASILLDRAISLCKAGSDRNQSRDIALLYLDQAWLEASQAHFAEAQNNLKQSIETIDDTKVPGLSRDLNNFNRQYMCTAVKLAQCYRHKGKPALAEEALKTIISRVDSGKSWLGVFDQSQGSAPDRSIPNLYYYYGRLLADRGDFAAARPYLDKAITASKNNVPGVMRFVRAKVAAAQKEYELAALYYSEVSQESYDHDVQDLIMMQPDLKVTYCRLALEFALKAKQLKAEELAKIYTRLADALRPESAKEQLELYNKAFSLMADGQEKQQLAIKIANLSSQQNATSNGAAAAAKIDHSAEFKMRETAALLAQKTNPNNAAQLWVSLANSEVSAKQYDAAIEHLKTAIATVQKQPPNSESLFMQSFSFYMMPLGALAEGGKKADAEAIGKLLLDKADDVYGKQSSQYRQALTTMFSIYAGQKDFKTANQYLDQILAIDPRKFELGRSGSPYLYSVEDMASSLTAKDDTRAYGMEALNKILINRLNTYGPDDMHTMDILSKIGQAETKAGNFTDAEKHLKMASGIANLYDASSPFNFRTSPVSAMQDLLNAQKRTDELKQLQDKIQINRKEAEKMSSIADSASTDATQKFYDYWHKKSPYNSRSLSSGIKLLESAVTKKDWPAVKAQAPECIKMLAHNSLFLVGGCIPSPSPATQKFYCFKNLIQACIETRDRQQALSWLKQAKSEKSYQPMIEELLFLSEIENICGNKKEALELCHQAEKALASDQNANYYRHSVNALYKKIGSEEDTQRVQLNAQAEQLIRIEADIRKSERERKQKAAEEASQKKLPAEAVAIGLDGSKNNKSENIENVWHPEPQEAQILENVQEIKDAYIFDYAALASTNLSLGDGAFVKQRQAEYPLPFPNYSFAGSFEGMNSQQPKHKAGNLMFLYDGPRGSLRPKVQVTQAPVDLQQLMQAHPGGTGATGVGGVGGPGFGGYGGRGTGGGGGAFLGGIMGPQFAEPPAVMARPFRPALTAPANSTALDGKSLILKAGDYIADKLTVERIVMPQPGRVRIFIKDNAVKRNSKLSEQKKAALPGNYDDKPGNTVFASIEGAFINKGGPWAFFQQRSTLEIWYNGTDTISLGDETKFTGIIYAPNATIRLGKGVEFLGAMVAKNIFAGEDTTITYLYDLHNWKQD